MPVVQVIDVAETTGFEHATPPIVTVAPVTKFDPAIVTEVPPVDEPDVGEIDDTVGAATLGVTADDACELPDVPPAFVAVDVNVYAVPFVKLLNEHEPDAPVTVQVAEPDDGVGDAVTVYDAGVPPVDGATTVTVAEPLPPTTVGIPGTPGAAGGEPRYNMSATEYAVLFLRTLLAPIIS